MKRKIGNILYIRGQKTVPFGSTTLTITRTIPSEVEGQVRMNNGRSVFRSRKLRALSCGALLVLLCLGLVGCTVVSTKSLEEQVTQLKEFISEKDQEIKKLQDLLIETESQIKEMEAKIQELKKRLEMFGVFEK